MALTRRSKPKTSVGSPKPLPARGKEEEPETTICKGAELVPTDKGYSLGYCTKCKVMPANSEVDHLCYDCHKEAAGFEYDGKTNRYTKVKGRK